MTKIRSLTKNLLSQNVLLQYYLPLRYMLTGLGRKNWRGGFREYYFGKNTYFGITKTMVNPGEN